MGALIAKIAVSAATYWIDRPYDYLVPEDMRALISPGMRVLVPFARGNRSCEGLVLALSEHSEYEKLKCIISILDKEPVLSQELIKLALFMRDRFFCTVYDAAKAMLPVGLWFDSEGRRRVNDKMLEMARLAVSTEEAAAAVAAKRGRSPQQANILEQLCAFEALPVRDMLSFTGASRVSLKALVSAGYVELYSRETYRRPEVFTGETEPLPILNDEQRAAFEGLSALNDKGAGAALLFGVTGSGKTSVYIHLIARQLAAGRGVLLLVPEIALTPQMLHTFSSHFGDEIAVLHSSLSVGERYDEWKRIKAGKAHVVIGTRSAVFAPVDKLSLIIIDEEQEETYKSENSPRYNARDVAKFRCVKQNAMLLLGSATPDICSMYNALSGKYSLFTLSQRYNDMELPQVEIVDMKRELRRGNGSDISGTLRDRLMENIDRGEQSILFINRRGANKLVSCGECGFTYKCPRCSVSLTYHSKRRRLMCHYCGHSRTVEEYCPDCGGMLRYIGTGTQNVEQQVKELFPDTEVLRVDSDTVTPAGDHEKLFERFRNEHIPVMVGTQMVTKGLNFENVTLVGVVDADQSLYAGSHRAGERSFSMITQVIGRSGRGEKPGRAVIQTYTPNNETIAQAAKQDYMEFYNSEIELRRIQNAPPFSDIFSITATGVDEEAVLRACNKIRDMLMPLGRQRPDVRILGPVPLPVVKVNNRFRYRVYICCKADAQIRGCISGTLTGFYSEKNFRGVSVFADFDPAE